MTTFTDGVSPSVTPEPEDGPDRRGRGAGHWEAADDGEPGDGGSGDGGSDDGDDGSDTGSGWLRDEIQRRIAEGGTGSGGRHARRDAAGSSNSVGYVPRHSVATPGPGAPRPGPVGGPAAPRPSELLRRERTNGAPQQQASPVAWSGPPRAEPAGSAPDPDTVRPGPGSSPTPGAAPSPSPSPSPRPASANGRGTASGAPAPSRAARTQPAPAQPPASRRSAPEQPAAQSPSAQFPVPQFPAAQVPAGQAEVPAGQFPAAQAKASTGQQPAAEQAASRQGAAQAPAAQQQAPHQPAARTAADQRTGDEPAVQPAGVTQPFDVHRRASTADPAQALSGDPLFTARTPAPGSRERAALISTSPPGSVTVPEQRGSDDLRGARFPPPEDPEPEARSRRVRVVLAERKGVARPVRTVVDIQEGTGVGELLRSNLIGSQLAVALRFAVGAGLTLGMLPLLFAMFPEIGRIELLGLRLPWLLLGVLVYPFLFGLGFWHTRTAERVEQNFADHVQD